MIHIVISLSVLCIWISIWAYIRVRASNRLINDIYKIVKTQQLLIQLLQEKLDKNFKRNDK